jgi:hypothetical protein
MKHCKYFGNWLNWVEARFMNILGWERLPLYGRFGYVEMAIFLMIKFFSYACNIPVYGFAPFMVIASGLGGPRPL